MKTSKNVFWGWNSHWDEQEWSKLRTFENLAKQIKFNSMFKDTVS